MFIWLLFNIHKSLEALMRTILCILLFFSVPGYVTAQPAKPRIDSLQNLLGKVKDDSIKATLMLQLGNEWVFLRPDIALENYQKAYDLGLKLNSVPLQLKANVQISDLYNRMGNYPGALQLSLENLRIAEKLHDTTSIFWAKRDILAVYINLHNNTKALELGKEFRAFAAAVISVDKKRKIFMVVADHLLGNIYQQMNQMDSALKYRQLVYDYAVLAKDTEGLALETSSLAGLYETLGKTDSAFYYYRNAITYGGAAGRFDIARGSKLALARLLKKQNLLDSAMYFARQSYIESKNVPDTTGMMDAAFLMSDLWKDRKQFDSAYAYLSSFTSLKNKSLAEEKIRKTQELVFNETLRKRQSEQERKEAEQEYNSKVKIYLLVGGLAIVLFVAFLLYRNNRQKQKANHKIEKAYKELKTTQAQLIQSEKMASLGELTAGIAHEIQNPLNFVNNFSEVNKELLLEMKDEIDKGNTGEVKIIADDIIANEEKIHHHGKRADAIVKGMLQHSRSSSGVKEPTDINALADEYLRLAYHGLRAKDKSFHATVKTDFDKSIGNVNIIPQDIGRVILNLINNAFYAVDEKKKSGVENYGPTVLVGTKKMNDKVEITVKDNGNGIPQKALDKIFQPFFTTKPTGEGTGLGLSLSYDIITKGHGGELKVETGEGDGSAFIVLLPTI